MAAILDQDDHDDPSTWPAKHALARKWDSSDLARESVRSNQKLLVWPSAAATGVANKTSLKQNRFAILKLLEE